MDPIRAAQAAGQASAIPDDFNQLCGMVSDLSELMSEERIQATLSGLNAWDPSGFQKGPGFDVTRDAVSAPRNGETATFIGSVILPNGDSSGPFSEAFATPMIEFTLASESFYDIELESELLTVENFTTAGTLARPPWLTAMAYARRVRQHGRGAGVDRTCSKTNQTTIRPTDARDQN